MPPKNTDWFLLCITDFFFLCDYVVDLKKRNSGMCYGVLKSWKTWKGILKIGFSVFLW